MSFHSLVSHSNQRAAFKCKIHDVTLTNDVATEKERNNTVQNFVVEMINLCFYFVNLLHVVSRIVKEIYKIKKELPLFHKKNGIAVLPIEQTVIPTLSRKHRHHDRCWYDNERAATERMKERESFLDGQWYRGKVRVQFRKSKLEATKNGEQERGAARERAGACSKVGACGEVTSFIKVQSAGLKNNRRT